MGGKLTVAGQTPLDAKSNLAIKTTIDHLRPLRRQDVRVSLSGRIDVTGSAEAPVVAGTIVVDNGAIQLENIEAGPSGVTTLPIAGEKELALREEAKAEKAGGKERKKGVFVMSRGRVHCALRGFQRPRVLRGFARRALRTRWTLDAFGSPFIVKFASRFPRPRSQHSLSSDAKTADSQGRVSFESFPLPKLAR